MLTVGVPLSVPGADAMIAWPTDLAFGADGRYAGFLMPRAPNPAPVTLTTLAQRRERETRLNANLSWDSLRAICANYAAAVATLHDCSVVVCDINLKNVVVSGNGTTTAIDCDSMQVTVGGKTYISTYAQPEFLAPEFKGVDLGRVPRTMEADRWALAVLIWMTLMDGHHPFAGVWRGSGELERDDRAAAGCFAYRPGERRLSPSPEVPPWRALPRELQALFLTAFTEGARSPKLRPSAHEWAAKLNLIANRLKQCDGASGRRHFFPEAELSCPWCEYEMYLNPPAPTGRRSSRKAAASSPKWTRPRPRPQPSPPARPQPSAAGFPSPLPSQPPPPPRPGISPRRGLALATLAVFLVAIAVLIAQGGGGSSPTSAESLAGGGGESSSAGADHAESEAAARRRAIAWAPERAIHAHYVALSKGYYRRAFGFMTPTYREQNPRWLEQVRTARPRFDLISFGKPRISGNVAWVEVEFFARDTHDTPLSDTVCRRFEGPVHMVKTYEGWRYSPTKDFEVTEKPYGANRCP